MLKLIMSDLKPLGNDMLDGKSRVDNAFKQQVTSRENSARSGTVCSLTSACAEDCGASTMKLCFSVLSEISKHPEQSQIWHNENIYWKSEYFRLFNEKRELEKEADELREYLREFREASKELKGIKESVCSLKIECQIVQSARDEYYAKSGNLDSLVKSLREAAERRKDLELEHQEAQNQLREKQDEIKQLHKNEVAGRRKHQEVIEALESKLREVEKKCELQKVRYEELSVEMESVQRQASRSRSLASVTTAEVQTSPESGTSTPDSALSSIGTNTGTATVATGSRMVNGETPSTTQRQAVVNCKPRFGHQKSDSGLGSSLDESVSSRKDYSSSSKYVAKRSARNLIHHPLSATVDRAVDTVPSAGDLSGRLSVFVTRFAYIPAKHSPNDIHDQELELKKGEFVIVFGDMDEDGYYEAETLDGRHGLVPSNYVERLPPEELVDFHASYPNNPAIASATTGMGPPIITGANLQGVNFTTAHAHVSATPGRIRFREEESIIPSDSVPAPVMGNNTTRPSSLSQSAHHPASVLRDPSNRGQEDISVAPPVNLVLEKQMHKSIMIGWSPAMIPINRPPPSSGAIDAYNVYVDGHLRCTVGANERCRALIEGVDLSSCHRVSVRSKTTTGRESMDSLCTILVGKDCPVMPTQLRITNITSNSATVSWFPANSNYQHSIFVNEQEYAIVPASSHRFTIPDLTASTMYRVRVVPIVPKSTLDYSSYLQACAQVEFKTLPDNVPDPPSTLQLESGPQDGTLLLTWTPVTAQRNCDVVGYAIYADGQKVKQIDSPTGDHALLDITRLQPPVPRSFTVRTVSSKSLSRDSPYLNVTEDVLLGRVKAVAQAQSEQPYSQPQTTQLQSTALPLIPASLNPSPGGHPPRMPSNRQTTVTFSDFPSRTAPFPGNSPGMFPPQGPSPDVFAVAPEREELSDIMEEVEEEAMMERMHRMGPFGAQFGRPNMPPRGGLRSPLMNRPGGRREPPLPESDMMMSSPGGPPLPPPQFGFARSFQGMNMGPPPGQPPFFPPGRFRDRPLGPDGMRRQNRRDDYFPAPYEDDYFLRRGPDRDRDRDPRLPREPYGAMQIRTSSLPQIEITKDDSFESMDSRHRAFSDREEERPRRSLRSRYNSPPGMEEGGSFHRQSARQRSQSRDRKRDRYDQGALRQDEYEEEAARRRGEDMRRDLPRDGYRDERSTGLNEPLDRRRGDGRTGGTLERNARMVRVFRANFDYDASMSPNVDADSEELSFKQGQLLKIYGDKDSDGFYKGDIQGRQGLVPCNLVSEVTDEATVRRILGNSGTSTLERTRSNPGKETKQPGQATVQFRQKNTNQPADRTAKGPVRRMVAMYDYDSKSASPNVDDEMELSFKKGDTIYVSGEMDEDGFFEGELNGKRGLVPSNFLRDASGANPPPGMAGARPPPNPSGPSSTNQARSNKPPPVIREPHDMAQSPRTAQSMTAQSRAPPPGASSLRPNPDMHGQSSGHLNPNR
ncbi:RIMS-binding protein 2-like isoform X2 [Paramacrobiotus metropolitanus]|uniref:RIMS-binding protein 2-like isoform X2 n=1 Tax=Paramacrobiotus metropolitanus TaxID=2943436 RepID=UPI002445E373|nr:RIMS-binding protein 2-like isoform X2 [Paramacrobiotus metropolitanus]